MDDLGLDLDVDFSEHLEAIREALAAFVDHARRAGLEAPVPTTPEWTVRQLVAHQGMVHRWATAIVRGTRVDPAAVEAEGLAARDPVLWLRDGGHRLVEALQKAPVDLDAPVFLNDAPPPRLFWARRQSHETTIHSVDALSAALGRVPNADDTWITRQIALDGIDELLTGFLTRKSSPLRSEEPILFGFRPTDVERSWLVVVGPDAPVVERNYRGYADVELEAPAEALYLAAWNRTDEIAVDGFDVWREHARVTWT
ncbi:MAG: hypothetical protein JWR64_1371 [Marmoricola sp.]|nr:hypothetical protein [Marmoricola sp.]